MPQGRPVTLDEELIIEAGRTERQYWRDIWRFREVFYFLVWRDLLVRYKQTIVGVAWSVIRPAVGMLILTVVFSRIGGLSSGNVPYPLLVLCGILPWQFFAAALSEGGASLVANAHLITKVYFPRMTIPISSVIIALVDFLIGVVLLVVVMAWYRFVPPATLLLLPLAVLASFITSLAVSLWVAALMVRYRDLRFLIPFVVQFGLFLSPVGFTSSVVPVHLRLIYSLNPVVGVIDLFRWAVLGAGHAVYLPSLGVSAAVVVLLAATGVWHFRRTERTFADVI